MDSSDDEDFDYSDEEMDDDGTGSEKKSSPSVNHNFKQKNQVKILNLREKDLVERQQEMISEASEFFSIDEDIATVLLLSFGWNKEKLIEGYYANPKQTLQKAGATFNLNYKPKKSISNDILCPVLFEEFNINDTLTLGCTCEDYPDTEDHRFSLEAWREYLKTKTTEGTDSTYTRCQRESCNCIIPPSIWERVLIGYKCKEDDYEKAFQRYEHYLLDNFVHMKPNIKWCPTAGCGRAVEIPESEFLNTVFCTNCENNFCFRCNKLAHAPLSCSLLDLWEEKCRNESETANWILANTKICPKCGVRIEKNQGCNHMTCTTCKHHFCWVCMGPWDEHGNSTGGYYNCNKFKEEKVNNDVSVRQKAKAELQKYLHYYRRFAIHDESLKFARKQFEDTKIRMQELQDTHGAGWIEVQFLWDAVKQLMENRRMLKFSYPLAYYLPDGRGKSLLEESQSMLEKYTETLSELTEKPIEDLDKSAVNNHCVVTKKFLVKIVEAVESEELSEEALAHFNLMAVEGESETS